MNDCSDGRDPNILNHYNPTAKEQSESKRTHYENVALNKPTQSHRAASSSAEQNVTRSTNKPADFGVEEMFYINVKFLQRLKQMEQQEVDKEQH